MMDHDMPGMGDGSDDMCEMSMVLNSGYKNLCILSSGWRITTKTQMLSSMVIIVFITIGYELFKKWAAAFEYRYNSMTESGASSDQIMHFLNSVRFTPYLNKIYFK